MTTTTSNTLSILDFMRSDRPDSDAAYGKTIHLSQDPNDGQGMIIANIHFFLDGSTGATYSFPGLLAVRATSEWESLCGQARQEIQQAVESGASIRGEQALRTVARLVEQFKDTNENLDMPLDDKLARFLTPALCGIWAAADAFCMELTGKLWEQGDEPVAFLRELPVDIYANRGRDLADSLFDVATAAHHKGVADRLIASRAKKPMSKAAKKKAATKAAKKARKR